MFINNAKSQNVIIFVTQLSNAMISHINYDSIHKKLQKLADSLQLQFIPIKKFPIIFPIHKMQAVRKKRQQLTRQIRSKQRFQKLAQNREQCFGNDHISLVTMIFYMIEKQTNEGEMIDQESFEQFLDLLGDEIRGSDESDKRVNIMVVEEVLGKYGKRLETFEEAVMKVDMLEQVGVVEGGENKKMLDLMRFLFRVEVIREGHLEILDALLESVKLLIEQLCESDLIEGNFSQFLQELTKLTQIKISLMKQLMILHELMKQWQEKDKSLDQQQVLPKQSQIISKLMDKWITNQVLFSFTFDPRITPKLTNQKSPQLIKLKNILQSFLAKYVEFIYGDNEMINTLVKADQVQNQAAKLIELVFAIFFMLDDSLVEKEVEITGSNKEEKQDEMFLFIDLTNELIKKIQQSKHDSECTKVILDMIVDCFAELPKIVVKNFVERKQLKQLKCIKQIRAGSQFYVSEKLCDNQPLVVRMLHLIEDMDINVLIDFVQLLSILTSYSDALIETLFKTQQFSGFYGRIHSFRSILQTVFIQHISIEVRRRGIWLLSNITGSEGHYACGLYIIEKFFMKRVLEEDYALSTYTKEELLVQESIIQTIMNYLSNLRHYQEVIDMMKINRVLTTAGYINENENPQQQHMLDWIIRLLGSIVRNLSESPILGQNQKILQVLIYSFYNVLSLEAKQPKNHEQSENIVLIIMERLEIPKNLELIYHNCGQSNKDSRCVEMLETLLDQIEKLGNPNE